jgi:hypothetical protein
VRSNQDLLLVSQAPLGQTGQVMDINAIAVFVASGDSAWLAGVAMPLSDQAPVATCRVDLPSDRRNIRACDAVSL